MLHIRTISFFVLSASSAWCLFFFAINIICEKVDNAMFYAYNNHRIHCVSNTNKDVKEWIRKGF